MTMAHRHPGEGRDLGEPAVTSRGTVAFARVTE
jgi:hypothetical protein